MTPARFELAVTGFSNQPLYQFAHRAVYYTVVGRSLGLEIIIAYIRGLYSLR